MIGPQESTGAADDHQRVRAASHANNSSASRELRTWKARSFHFCREEPSGLGTAVHLQTIMPIDSARDLLLSTLQIFGQDVATCIVQVCGSTLLPTAVPHMESRQESPLPLLLCTEPRAAAIGPIWAESQTLSIPMWAHSLQVSSLHSHANRAEGSNRTDSVARYSLVCGKKKRRLIRRVAAAAPSLPSSQVQGRSLGVTLLFELHLRVTLSPSNLRSLAKKKLQENAH